MYDLWDGEDVIFWRDKLLVSAELHCRLVRSIELKILLHLRSGHFLGLFKRSKLHQLCNWNLSGPDELYCLFRLPRRILLRHGGSISSHW